MAVFSTLVPPGSDPLPIVKLGREPFPPSSTMNLHTPLDLHVQVTVKASVAIASGSDLQFPKDESWVVRLEVKRSTSSGSGLWLITFGQSIQSDIQYVSHYPGLHTAVQFRAPARCWVCTIMSPSMNSLFSLFRIGDTVPPLLFI